MIPLKDESRSPRGIPFLTIAIILVNVIVFVAELANGDPFVTRWSMVPADITSGHNWITLITSMFMHGGWLHIIGNMLFLWVFGPEIEDVMGSGRYIAFYILGGLVANASQIAMDPTSKVLSLGASGAIAAVMGAFLVTFPKDQIKSVITLGPFITVRLVPAVLLMVLWFVTQVFSQMGVASTTGAQQSGGVAYAAHVGGFLFGAIFGRLFEHKQLLAEEN